MEVPCNNEFLFSHHINAPNLTIYDRVVWLNSENPFLELNEDCIQLHSVVRTFGSIEALKGLSVKIRCGERVSLLGPNGAGKSTTLKIIAGLLKEDSGEVLIKGYRPNSIEAKKLIGYLPEDPSPYISLSVQENLEYIGSIRGTSNLSDRIDYLLNLLSLEKYRKSRPSSLSRGNRQKLGLALSLVHNPKILIMDEPLNYLDIPSQERVFEMLNKLNATFLVSTHIMSIAERLTDRVIMISNGHWIWNGTIEELRERGDPSEPIESIVSRLMTDAS